MTEIALINLEYVLDHAFFIPNFSSNPKYGSPSFADRFWLIPQSFCDRFGWDAITSVVEVCDNDNADKSSPSKQCKSDNVLLEFYEEETVESDDEISNSSNDMYSDCNDNDSRDSTF